MQDGRKRILCVDDHTDTCELIEFYLGDAGYEVIIARGIADSLPLIKKMHFDLYLIDEILRDGTGVELAHRIRAFDSTTPLVFHSASAHARDIRRGLDAGAQAYITKPSDPDEVIKIIKTLIAESERVICSRCR
jgi:DNA-binding response OmpR family regulator